MLLLVGVADALDEEQAVLGGAGHVRVDVAEEAGGGAVGEVLCEQSGMAERPWMPVMAISTVSDPPSTANSTPSSSTPRFVSIFNCFIATAKLQRFREAAKRRNTDNFRSIQGELAIICEIFVPLHSQARAKLGCVSA